MRAFNDAWWAAQPAEVQKLRGMSTDTVGNAALDLHLAGFVIDLPIVVWGWAADLVHEMRTNIGCPWVGSFEGFNSAVPITNQGPFWMPQPWDYTKMPKGYLPTVYMDQTDAAGNLRRLDVLYPPPPPPVVPPPTAVNPIGYAFGVTRDYTAPDGTKYNGLVFASNVATGSDGDKYTAPNGSVYILGVVKQLIGESRLWYQIS